MMHIERQMQEMESQEHPRMIAMSKMQVYLPLNALE